MQVAGWVQQLRYELASFLVATLPERAKERERIRPYATTRMHVLSGAVEFFAATALFIVAMIRYVVDFSNREGYTAIASMPQTDYGTFFGVGALAYLSFFITPRALLLVYCVAEGIVRAFETALTGRMLGMAVVALPCRAVEVAVEQSRRARTRALIGPSRPDEVELPDRSRSGLLEIFSVEDKPWSEVQVVEYLGTFYVLSGKRLVPRGAHHAYRYTLHPTEDRDVIRGSIVRYGPRAPAFAEQEKRTSVPVPGSHDVRTAARNPAEPAIPPPTPEAFAAARRNGQSQPEQGSTRPFGVDAGKK